MTTLSSHYVVLSKPRRSGIRTHNVSSDGHWLPWVPTISMFKFRKAGVTPSPHNTTGCCRSSLFLSLFFVWTCICDFVRVCVVFIVTFYACTQSHGKQYVNVKIQKICHFCCSIIIFMHTHKTCRYFYKCVKLQNINLPSANLTFKLAGFVESGI